jgi:tetratricopeptide (TPR) repeat protein
MNQIPISRLSLTIFMCLLSGCVFPGVVYAITCENWVGKIVSMQGKVCIRRSNTIQWTPAKINDIVCPGDMVHTHEKSRAAIILRNEVILRLDQKSTIIVPALEKKNISVIDIINGGANFFSRSPRGLKVRTPFVNAFVEGTEFYIEVNSDQTRLSIFEGQVEVRNEAGGLILSRGESAIAKAGKAPVPGIVVSSRDAVQWALYYPPVIYYQTSDFGSQRGWQEMVRRSIKFYWNGDLTSAFFSIEEVPEDIQDHRFFTYRAGLLLTVGCVDEAGVDIERALNLDPSNSEAFALRSIIAVVQNKKDKALDLARKAVKLSPESPSARVALSYAQQADFDLQGALSSLRKAVNLGPENALAWSRLSELWLSFGDLDKALKAAKTAVALNPNIARTQTVLGFSYMTQFKMRDAERAFKRAIELDQAAPLPRLGLGLTEIRQGDLQAGRKDIEIAASLDPVNSIIRSYLGKAYYEEKRDRLAENQFEMAREFDPRDPTAWFYNAILKQSRNRPVEAWKDLQKSIELNDKRAVYRSRLMLDEDLAARSAGLARIYKDLGFQQLALVEGWNSVNVDPANYSAHRFLADSYATLPRHEIARVSELLQSQLLQPVNITPVQPQLAESSLLITPGAGPSDTSFNEFNPLFERNRLALQASGVAGGNSILGDELVQSGLHNRFSYSLGQFHYETDGFRNNNDLETDIYNIFAQGNLSPKVGLQAEFRHKDTKHGDLALLINPDSFDPFFRSEERSDTYRFGIHYAPATHSDFIGSVIYQDTKGEHFYEYFDFMGESDGYIAEAQYLFRKPHFSLISGGGHYKLDSDRTFGSSSPINFETEHNNGYIYSHICYPSTLTWLFGVSYDSLNRDQFGEDDQLNPKFGIIWNILPDTTLRLAGFRVLKRTLIADQTIEPTHVAGFNQFFDDYDGTESTRYGAALDHSFSSNLYGGLELSKRDLEVPIAAMELITEDWEEKLYRAYLYWTPHQRLAASLEYQYEKFDRDVEDIYFDTPITMKTHLLPLTLRYFDPSGFFACIKTTYADQEVKLLNGGRVDDKFMLCDLSAGFRLPGRYGILSLEVKNLFDKGFHFQGIDFRTSHEVTNPFSLPERTILARFTLAF